MKIWLDEEERYVEVNFWSLWKAYLGCAFFSILVSWVAMAIIGLLIGILS